MDMRNVPIRSKKGLKIEAAAFSSMLPHGFFIITGPLYFRTIPAFSTLIVQKSECSGTPTSRTLRERALVVLEHIMVSLIVGYIAASPVLLVFVVPEGSLPYLGYSWDASMC